MKPLVVPPVAVVALNACARLHGVEERVDDLLVRAHHVRVQQALYGRAVLGHPAQHHVPARQEETAAHPNSVVSHDLHRQELRVSRLHLCTTSVFLLRN